MASRSEKVLRRQRRKEKKRKGKWEVGAAPSRPEVAVVVSPPGATKMSEVLLELIQPEWNESVADEDSLRKLLTLGAAAWNASLMPAAERRSFLNSFAETLPAELRPDFHEILEPLIRRKEEQFPHIKRPILSFELSWQASYPQLSVMSGFTPG
jgi:hypothetical protein